MYFRVAALTVLIAALSFTAAAQKGPTGSFGHWGMSREARTNHALQVLERDLNLTASQVSQVRDLIESRQGKLKSAHEEMMPKFQYLMGLLRQPNPDPATVGKATIALKQAHEQVRAEQAALEADFLAILDDSQRQKVNRLKTEAPAALALYRLRLITPEWMGTEQAFLSNE
jgi:Spy/CpxP family protein refolding chaperone